MCLKHGAGCFGIFDVPSAECEGVGYEGKLCRTTTGSFCHLRNLRSGTLKVCQRMFWALQAFGHDFAYV